MLSLCSAFATAESSSLPTSCETARSESRSVSRAVATSCPVMRRRTGRIFVGDVRRWRRRATVCRSSLPVARIAWAMSAPHRPLLPGVEPERARGGELAELVPDHRLADVDRDVLAPVVHGDRVPDHVGRDRRTTRPRLDDLAVAGRVHLLHLLREVVVDERALLQAAGHRGLLPTFGCRDCGAVG